MPLVPLFLFEKFLLLKPASPNNCLASHMLAQLSNQTRDCPGQVPSWPNSPQLVSTVSVGARHPCVFGTLSLLPPCNFMYPGPSWCCSSLVWPGREPVDPALSQEPYGRPGRCQAWGYSHPGHLTDSRVLIVLKHSPCCLIFQCPLQFLASNFHIYWVTVGCSLCSS